MRGANILIVGGGIGGLTSAISLRKQGFDVDVIERDPNWSVYGVGIIQQPNAVRAMAQLGLLDEYCDAGFGFDYIDVFAPNGAHLAKLPTPALVPGYSANIGIGRPALHRVLSQRVLASGARVRLGVTAVRLEDDGRAVHVEFSDRTTGRYDLVIGADGVNSTTRSMIFPDAPGPQFTGQGVWRHNFERPAEVVTLHIYQGAIGVGLVPLSKQLMYMYVTTPEPGNPHYPQHELAAVMRAKVPAAAPGIAKYLDQIVTNEEVVYRPLEWLFLRGDWHKGRVVLLGDAVHATTPHLGQGAGMAIEDSIVLADELARAESAEAAFRAFRHRRFDRCKYIVEQSKAICDSQLGRLADVDQARAAREMSALVAQPI